MFWCSFLRAPLVLVAPLDPLAKLERTYVYICFLLLLSTRFVKTLFCCLVIYLTVKMSDTNVNFADSQGNNGRPGKPGDRGAPGPQVRDVLQCKEHETLMDTSSHLDCKYGFCLSNIFFVLNCRVLVDSPEPLDFQEWRDTEWVLIFWPELFLRGTYLNPTLYASKAPKQKKMKEDMEELHLCCLKINDLTNQN